jgi:hypothetical protein
MTTPDLIGSGAKLRALLESINARAIHEASPRRRNRFVALNCAAIPSALLERRFQHIRLSAFPAASVLLLMACAKKQGGPTNAAPMQVSVATVGQRDVPLDDIHPYHACSGRTTMLVLRRLSRPSRYLATLLLSLSFSALVSSTMAQSSEDAVQDTPLISGQPLSSPGPMSEKRPVRHLLATPVGTHLSSESHIKPGGNMVANRTEYYV